MSIGESCPDITMVFPHASVSRSGGGIGRAAMLGAAMIIGDGEEAESGESGEEESRPRWSSELDEASNVLGLSFPVGPFPRGGRLEGGRLRACLNMAFSSSSSAFRSSSA